MTDTITRIINRIEYLDAAFNAHEHRINSLERDADTRPTADPARPLTQADVERMVRQITEISTTEASRNEAVSLFNFTTNNEELAEAVRDVTDGKKTGRIDYEDDPYWRVEWTEGCRLPVLGSMHQDDIQELVRDYDSVKFTLIQTTDAK